MYIAKKTRHHSPLLWLLATWSLPLMARGQCPWSRELVDLHTDCVCAYSNNQRLSIQCSPVNFTRLVQTLRTSVKGIPIDLLYISNSTVEILRNGSFQDLNIQSLHVSKSKIREVEGLAFGGLEESLTSLNLQDNFLREVPSAAMRNLTSLQLLDLSHNLIREVAMDAFADLPLTTLKLSDNRVNLSELALRGLEGSLGSLHLQACELTAIPAALRRLQALAFLDLAQNRIAAVEAGSLSELRSLTALNLERNRIEAVGEGAFAGVNATLSSLSLLNNQLVEWPSQATAILMEIRVLDLGFNRITNLPHDAFIKNKYLTLLALDGNPLTTIPLEAFLHLNSTLRGLSIGGSTLHCDCHLRWISEWVKEKGLQVTSRERNPQFCGQPEHLRKRPFIHLVPDDFICAPGAEGPSTAAAPPLRQGTKRPKRLESDDFETVRANDLNGLQAVTADKEVESATRGDPTKTTPGEEPAIRSGTVSRKTDEEAPPSGGAASAPIRIRHAYKRDSSLVLEWEGQAAAPPPLGYQVVVRVFGHREPRRVVAVPADKRKAVLENLPLGQCMVVCVIEYQAEERIRVEELNPRQCRELKGDDSRILSLDKIVIAASSIVCVIVIIGALVVILFYLRRRGTDRRPPKLGAPPLAPGSQVILKPPPETDWETLSWNSGGRSTPKTAHCKSGSTSHSFVLGDGALPPLHKSRMLLAGSNGFVHKAYSTHDNESRLSYTHVSNKANSVQNNLDIQRSKSLTRPSGYHPYTGAYVKKAKKHRNVNGRLASASSSTECESDWNGGRSIWRDNDVDIYVSHNHMVPGAGNKKYRKDYGVR